MNQTACIFVHGEQFIHSAAGLNPSNESRASAVLIRQASDSRLALQDVVVCSYLDATNEFSDIPMIEGMLKINNAKDALQKNGALIRWKDISDKVEVRVFSIKTLLRGFADIAMIPDVKSSFFGETKLFFLHALNFLISL